MSFPEQLRKARINMGYTQQHIADVMGITKSTYCGYETGKRQPDVPKIKQLANILKTSGDVLLETGFEDTDTSPSEKKQELIEKVQTMSDEEVHAFLTFINSLEQSSHKND